MLTWIAGMGVRVWLEGERLAGGWKSGWMFQFQSQVRGLKISTAAWEVRSRSRRVSAFLPNPCFPNKFLGCFPQMGHLCMTF